MTVLVFPRQQVENVHSLENLSTGHGFFLTVPVAELRKNNEGCGWDMVSAKRSPSTLGLLPCIWIWIRKTS